MFDQFTSAVSPEVRRLLDRRERTGQREFRRSFPDAVEEEQPCREVIRRQLHDGAQLVAHLRAQVPAELPQRIDGVGATRGHAAEHARALERAPHGEVRLVRAGQ